MALSSDSLIFRNISVQDNDDLKDDLKEKDFGVYSPEEFAYIGAQYIKMTKHFLDR